MAYGNSCLNPILYAFFSTNYRQAFWSIICCGRRSITAPPNALNGVHAEYQTGRATFHKSPPLEDQTKDENNENGNAMELRPLVQTAKIKTQETIYNGPSIFQNHQKNGQIVHEVQATLH